MLTVAMSVGLLKVGERGVVEDVKKPPCWWKTNVLPDICLTPAVWQLADCEAIHVAHKNQQDCHHVSD